MGNRVLDDRQIIEATWPNYSLLPAIGQGRYGAVYKLVCPGDPSVRQAVKVIHVPKMPTDVQEISKSLHLASKEDVRDYFKPSIQSYMEEVKAMIKLARHDDTDYVVAIDDYKLYEIKEPLSWIILIRMEYLEPLYKQLSLAHIMPLDQVLHIGHDVAMALAACHRNRIIHKDVKATNILCRPDGGYKLGDFGFATHLKKRKSASFLIHHPNDDHVKRGTFDYSAPELLLDKPYDYSVDEYSLGILLYRLLNRNRFPFMPIDQVPTANIMREARLRRLALEHFPPPVDAPAPLAHIIMKACSPTPWDRYASMEAFLEDYKAYLEGEGYDFTAYRQAYTPVAEPPSQEPTS